MPEREPHEEEIMFKNFFVPLTPLKAIYWIIIIGLLVYFNNLFNGFVGDDNAQILTNPLVHSASNFLLLFKGSTFYLSQGGGSVGLYYKPLLLIVYSIIYSLFGANAFFFHAIQLVFHISNAILIFLIFKKLFNKNIAFVLSLLFLLHPINNETVVYISDLQEELFSFFGLLALFFLSRIRLINFIPILLLLSLLSKETGIIFIPILLIYYFLFSDKTKIKVKKIIFSLSAVVIFYAFLRIVVGNIGLQTKLLYMSENATFFQRLLTIPSMIFYYLKMLFIPVSIAFGWYYVIKNPTFSNFGFPLLVIMFFCICITLPLFTLRSNKILLKKYVFFLAVFIISILPFLQIIPLDLTVADRWFYIPLFSFLGLIGVIYELYSKGILQKKYLRIGGVSIIILILLFFSIRDVTRNNDWANSFSICQHDEQINTQSYLLEYCLGNELYNIKEYNQAKLHTQKAVSLYPQYFLSWYTLGKIEYAQNDRSNAQRAFEKTLSYNDFGYGSEELALILVYEKNPKEARAIAQKYLKRMPNSAQLWYALALADYKLGLKEEAISAAKNAYILEPTPITYKVYYRLSKNLPISF